MRWRLSLALVIVAVATSSDLNAFPPGIHRARTRPVLRRGIPKADYNVKPFRSRIVTATSLPATLLVPETSLPIGTIESERAAAIIQAAIAAKAIKAEDAVKIIQAASKARAIDAPSAADIIKAANDAGVIDKSNAVDFINVARDTGIIDAANAARIIETASATGIIDQPSPTESETTPHGPTPADDGDQPEESGQPQNGQAEEPSTGNGAIGPESATPASSVEISVLKRIIDRMSDRAGAGQVVESDPAEDGNPVKLFQLRRSRLQIDHCSISRFAWRLQEDGHWELSLRADQNPREQQRLFGRSPRYNPHLYIKQNEFVVTIRCYGQFRTFRRHLDRVTGKPVIGEVGPIKFWVRNGQPMYLNKSSTDAVENGESNVGKIALTQEQFEQIDRVEVEFYYQ